MGRSKIYDKWVNNKSFIIENDILKEKTYVFAPFPKTNQYGFQNADIRKLIAADVISRYQRLQDKNVLFPIGFHSLGLSSFNESKKNSNKLDDKIANIFERQMLELGIGINYSKFINMRHDEYVGNLQLAFIEMYEKKYIEYKATNVFVDKVTGKSFDSFYNEKNDYDIINQMSFVLNISGLLPQIVKDINNLECDTEIKNYLLSKLNPTRVMKLNLLVSNGSVLSIHTDRPELMGGISFIFLNPEYIDITEFTAIDEYASVMQYLDSNGEMFVYSGTTAVNPLTGVNIPIFICTNYDEEIHLGIPSIDDDDYALANNFGLNIIKIIRNNVLINSDFLDGLTLKEANERIFSTFIEADIANECIVYNKNEIVLSSSDTFGPLFPFLYDYEANQLNSLKKYIPYTFSNQFRPILAADVNVLGDSLPGTINNLFVEGMCPIISIIYDEISSNESVFSLDAKQEYEAWNPCSFLFVDKNSLISQLLMPIIFYNIIKKEFEYTIPDLFNKVIIVDKTLDAVENDIKRSNNNLIDFDDYLKEYYADSIRLFSLSTKLDTELIFNKYVIDDYDKLIKRLEGVLINTKEVDSKRLDYYFYKLLNQCKNYLDNYCIYEYVETIKDFIDNYIFKEIFNRSQLLLFLLAIYPICPYLAEKIYEEIWHSKYSIINEGWPDIK
ncbi:MAG: class I tRNA ligase family protein [Anaeroplasma sp.]